MHNHSVTRRVLTSGILAALVLGFTTGPVRAVPEVKRFKEFAIPSPGADPGSITAGPDGNLWFTESLPSMIGAITTSGQVANFDLPRNSEPVGITAGPDGNVWFTEPGTYRVGRITPTGIIRHFPVPTPFG